MKTKHNENCQRVFNRYDSNCARCQELMAGAKPRAGWNDRKKQEETKRREAIKNHDFVACAAKNGCCTCFDW